MRHFFSGANLVSLSAIILFASSSAPQAMLAARQDEPKTFEEWAKKHPKEYKAFWDEVARPPKEVRERQEKMRTRSRALAEVLEKAMPRPGRLPHDVAPTIERLDFSIEKIFRFVRDEIRNEPYRGVIRGTAGVLMGRGGNALEKSIALRALLEGAGYKSRLIHGRLSADRAAQWVERFLQALIRLPEVPGHSDPDPKRIAALARRIGVPAPEIERAVRDYKDPQEGLGERAWAIASPHAEGLVRAISAAEISMRMDFGRLRDRWVKAAQDYFWVEYEDPKSKRWTALDPGFAEASPGTAIGEGRRVLSAIPGELVGQVGIALEVDRIAKGKRERITILEVRIPTTQPLFEPVRFSVVPADPPEEARIPDGLEANESDLYDLLSRSKRFQALIEVGKREYASQPFDLTGKLYNVSASGSIESLAERIGGLLDFGGGAKKSELRSLDLKITLRLPGRRPAVQTRRIYAPPSSGDAPYLHPSLKLSLLVQPNLLSGEFWEAQEARKHLVLLRRSLGEKKDGGGCGCGCYPITLLRLATIRQDAVRRILAGQAQGVGLLWDVPTVSLHWQRWRVNPREKKIQAVEQADLLENGAPFVPLRADASAAAWRMNLALGVFDSCAEGLLFENPALGLLPDFAVRRFERARIAGLPFTVLPSRARGDRLGATFSKRAADWIEKNTPEEDVLATSGPGRADHWWSVDPATGSCVARLSDGSGGSILLLPQTLTEYIVKIANHLKYIPAGQRLWSAIWCAFFIALSLLLIYVKGAGDWVAWFNLGMSVIFCMLDVALLGWLASRAAAAAQPGSGAFKVAYEAYHAAKAAGKTGPEMVAAAQAAAAKNFWAVSTLASGTVRNIWTAAWAYYLAVTGGGKKK